MGSVKPSRRSPMLDWASATAPGLSDFETLAWEAFMRLPRAFRDMCGDINIRVADFPDDAVVEELNLDSEFDLLGLYHGVDLTSRSFQDPPTTPPMVHLYRRPILDYWAEYEETLGGLIAHVLVHEIGHHFGLSDAQMEAIEDAADDANDADLA